VDYLLKPIRKDRLAAAMEKAQKLTLQQLQDINAQRDEPVARTHISVRLRGNIRLVPVEEIIYFMADSKYVTIRTPTEEHLVEESLVNIEKEFGEDRFLRVHRNALVAVQAVQGIEKGGEGGWQVVLKGTDKRIDISRRHAANVRRWARG
jgi:two-component system response regulator AlgR